MRMQALAERSKAPSGRKPICFASSWDARNRQCKIELLGSSVRKLTCWFDRRSVSMLWACSERAGSARV